MKQTLFLLSIYPLKDKNLKDSLLENICLAFFMDKTFINTIILLLNSALKYTINHGPRT